MSTRERAQILFDRLNDEQIEKLVEYIEDNFLPEPPNAVHSIAEIEEKLAEAEDDVRNGRVMSWEEVKSHLRGKYGIWTNLQNSGDEYYANDRSRVPYKNE